MLAGAVRHYLRRFGVAAGRRAVLFADNDAAYATAFDLHAAGVAVAAILDVRDDSLAGRAAKAAGLDVRFGHEVAGTAGRPDLRQVLARKRGETLPTRIEADLWRSAAASSGDRACEPGAPADPLRRADRRLRGGGRGCGCERGRGARPPRHPRGCGRRRSRGPSRGGGLGFRRARSGAASGPARLGRLAGGAVPGGEGDKARPSSICRTTSPPRISGSPTAKAIPMSSTPSATRRMAWRPIRARSAGSSAAPSWRRRAASRVAKVGLPTFRPYAMPVAWGALAGDEVGARFRPERRLPLHDWHERERRRLRQDRAVAAAARLLAEPRHRLGAGARGGARGAPIGRHHGHVLARQDRRARAGRGGLPRPDLRQHLLDPARSAGPATA